MVSHLFILRVIKLFKEDVTLFCRLVFSFQHISKLCHGLLWKCLIQPLYLFFYDFLQTFPHSPYLDTFLKGQGHLHRQRCCLHTILTLHVCLSFPYMMPCLFSQPSMYSSYPCTVHRLVLKYFQSLPTA